MPAGFTPDGTPEGVEFMAAAFEDAKLLQVAYGYEQLSHLRKLPTLTPALPGEKFDYLPSRRSCATAAFQNR